MPARQRLTRLAVLVLFALGPLFGISPTADASAESLHRVRRATERVTRLANQLLALARAESGQCLDDADQVALAPLIDDLIEDWVSRADAAQIDLGVQREPCSVVGEPTLLRELIANLVDNALKYTPPGGRVTLRCARGEGGVSIDVARTHLDFFAFTGHSSWHDMEPMEGGRESHWK